ncbi:MAG TPA: type II toxin-antitoxin system VapC family toxin [Chitinophagaceae bacterium]|nr:type II toxin-antitoxin system VapC family toxin [Chitinophagaceae bacterium]
MNYLFDTNVIIDLLDAKLPVANAGKLANIIVELSSISKIELLGYHKITPAHQLLIENFLQQSIIYPMDETIINRAIIIRRQTNLKTPDAIIAATAIENNLPLLTHNIKDFGRVTGLNVIDPYTL